MSQNTAIPGFMATLATLLLALGLSGCGGGLEGSQAPDPVAVDLPIVYVKRPLPVDNNGNLVQGDARDPAAFNAGGDLYIRDQASPSATERNLTGAITGGMGDVRDLDVSYDGTKVVFALHLPLIPGAQPDQQPTWNIWEYDRTTDTLRRIIPDDITAEAGQDLAPHYLPDGRIVFTSSRQRRAKAILLDDGKPQFSALDEDENNPAMVLHVMDAQGNNIKQISYNQSHDLDPTVLSDGRILFSRWDHMGGRNEINLYSTRPDGTDLHIQYGAHSHQTGTNNSTVQFLQPRELEDGRAQVLLRPFTSTQDGGDLVNVDINNFIDNNQPTWSNIGLVTGTGQTPATSLNINTTGISPGGRFGASYPLLDGTNRMLVSWSICRLMEGTNIVPCTPDRLAAPNPVEAPPLYGLYIYNMDDDTQQPVVAPTEGILYSEVAVMAPRTPPPIIFDAVPGVDVDQDLVNQGVGVLHIRSVYDLDGVDTATPDIATLADPAQTTADQRPARFLRIVKATAIPEDVPATAYGRSRGQLMREIIGYAPIEPDGSVKIKVPADMPLAISVVDKNGRRISARHRNWLQVRPGEVLECNGCHNHASGLPHGHPDGPPSVNPGAPTTGLPFPNTVATFWANMGESMAETRARISCLTDCAAMNPSVDLVYDDVWTDPVAAGRQPDASFSYRYANLSTPVPTSSACLTTWSSGCRIIINYETHIHPIWNVDRPVLDANGNTIGNNRCNTCHNVVDAMGAAQVPAGQLDLSDGPSSDEPDHFKSYRELFFQDNAQELVNGTLQDQMVQATDANGNPIFQTDANGNLILDANGNPIPVLVPVPAPPPSMSTAGANASSFFGKFDAGGTHAGWLTPDELRLIAEWLDIGAQYYNDPFAVPPG